LQHFGKFWGTFSRRAPEKGERGNILFIILIAIALIALLTELVSLSSQEQSDAVTRQIQDDQISRMMDQASALSGALNQMALNGEDDTSSDPTRLYNKLNQVKPGEAGYETPPHSTKIYHPYGGGITYMSASTPDPDAVAFGYAINAKSIITGIGDTDVTVGDIVFTAKLATAAACQRVNTILSNSGGVPPVMATATFDALFTAGTTVTVSAANCASCVNVARLCVSNTGATAWGFYAALYPG
jgi:hypothetical protein